MRPVPSGAMGASTPHPLVPAPSSMAAAAPVPATPVGTVAALLGAPSAHHRGTGGPPRSLRRRAAPRTPQGHGRAPAVSLGSCGVRHGCRGAGASFAEALMIVAGSASPVRPPADVGAAAGPAAPLRLSSSRWCSTPAATVTFAPRPPGASPTCVGAVPGAFAAAPRPSDPCGVMPGRRVVPSALTAKIRSFCRVAAVAVAHL